MNIRQALSLFLPIAGFFHTLSLLGGPVGGTVVAGSATINRPGAGVLTINQTSDRAIINWTSFSINAGELTRFNQPSVNAATLNRVLSGNPSEIYGTLQANGHVYLINPSGILVGPSGQINTRSFVGSTLNLSDSDFLSGVTMKLSGSSSASIKNQGSIDALGGDVFLFAHTVDNSGTIRAPGGTVGLGAGSEVLLQQAGGNERIAVSASSPAQPGSGTGINNVGAIEAASAELKAAGGNIYALAINNGGVVRATGLAQENGRIVLRAGGGNIQNSGVLSARNADGSGGSISVDGGHNASSPSTVVNSGLVEARGEGAGTRGGDVKITGDRVGLLGHAVVDVSGDAGGGTALIGGDLHGANPDVQNAQRTLVGSDAVIKADALNSGDGGKVVVWGDEWTRFFGNISATGGGPSGNGGFAEVSGKNYLEFAGSVNLAGAGSGRNGTLLLDPATITVQAANPDINGDGTVGDDIAALTDLNTTGDFSGANSVITATAVSSLLSGSVTLVLAATTSETIAAAITGSGNANLTLNAPTVTINAPISLAGSGVLSGNGTFNINSEITAGSVSLNAVNFNVSGSSTANPAVRTSGNQTYAGAVTLGQDTVLESTAGGAITFSSTVNGANSLAVNTAGATTFNGIVGGVTPLSALTTDEAGAAVGSKGGTTVFSMSASGTTAGVNAGGLTLNDPVTVDVNSSATGRPSVRTGSGGQLYNGPVSLSQNAVFTTTSGGDIQFNSTVDSGVTAAFLEVNSAGNVIFGFSGNPSSPSVHTGSGNQTYNGAVRLNQDTVLSSSSGNIVFSSTINSSGNGATTSDHNGLQTSSTALTLGGVIGGNPDGALGTLSLSTKNAFTINQTMTAQKVTVHSGTDGAGDLSFGPSVTINADTQEYQAGDGQGGSGPSLTAKVDLLTQTPQFRATAGGSAAPLSFTYRQDAAIADAVIPDASQFGATTPQAYILQSDDGAITVSTSGNFANSSGALTLNAAKNILFDNNFIYSGNSLSAHSGRDGNNTVAQNSISFGTAVQINANSQSYQAGDGPGAGTSATASIVGNTPTFHASGGSGAPGTFVFEQDSAIDDAHIPGQTQFGNAVPSVYTIQSADSSVTLSTAGKVQGSALMLSAGTTLTIGGASFYDLASLSAAGNSISLNVAGGSTANPTIQTSGGQSYQGAVSLSVNTVLASTSGGDIQFNSSVDSSGSAHSLELNTTGNEIFGGRVGASVGLLSLTTDADAANRGGQAIFNVSGSATATPSVKTSTGDQIYNDAVVLSQDTVLTAAGGSGSRNVTFNSTVNGAHSLEVNSPGVTHFDGQVGLPGTMLTSLKTDAPGTTELCGGVYAATLTAPDLSTFGGTINSGSALVYANSITLCLDTTITAPSVSFSSSVNGSSAGMQSLAVNGNATFGGAVGGSAALKSVSVSGSTAINGGGVTTSAAGGGSGDQIYTGPVTLGANTVLTGATPTFGSTIAGNGHNLSLDFSGLTLIDGAKVTGVKNLSTGNGGLTELQGLITTSGSQTYNDDVQLLATTALDTTSGGAGANISFGGTLTGITPGAEALTLTAGNGSVSFAGSVGATPLGAVSVVSGNDLTAAGLNAASLQAAISGTATLNGPVNTTTPAGVDLSASAIQLNNPITTFGGPVSLSASSSINSVPAGTITTTALPDTGIGSGSVQITASGSGGINLQGGINTRGANGLIAPGAQGGTVTITTADGSISVADINTSGGNSAFFSFFFGGNAAPIALSAGNANGITLNGNLTAQGGGGLFFGAPADVSLNAGNGVNQLIGNIVGANLLLTGAGDFSLTHSGNNMNVIAASVDGAVSYTDADNIQVGSVGLVSGISAGNHQVTLTADSMDILQGINSGTARTLLQPLTPGREIELGYGSMPTRLNLSQSELDQIIAGVLEISQGGHIDVSAFISLNPAKVSTLSLVNSGAIDGAGSLSVQNLRISSAGPVSLSGANSVGTLAAVVSSPNQPFYFNNVGDLSIGTVDTVSGITTADADITLVTAGKLSLASDLNAGAGSITLNHSDLLSGSGTATGHRLSLQGAANVGAPGAGNSLNTSVDEILLAKTGGNTFLKQDNARAVDLSGSTAGGDITLNSGAATVNNTPLDAGAGSVTLNTTSLGLGQNISAGAVVLNNSGALTYSAGSVNANTLTLQGGGDVGAAGAANSLNTSVNAISIAKSGGNTFINQDAARAVDIGGNTGGGDVTLTAGATTVNGAVLDGGAGNVTLNTTTLALGQNVNGATVTLNNSGFLSQTAGRINAGTLALQGAGTVGSLLNRLSVAVGSITLAKIGGDTFLQQDNTKAVNIGGVTGGGSVSLDAGATTVNTAALDAGAGNVVLNTTTLALGQDVQGGALTINNSGALTHSAGTLSGTSLTLQGAGAVGASGANNNLNTSVASIVLAKTGGNTFINQDTAQPVDISGSSSGSDITLTAGNVTVNTAALNAGAGNVTLNTAALGLGQDVLGASVTFNNSGQLTRSAGIVSASVLTLQGSGQVGDSGTLNNLNISVNSLALDKNGGDTFITQDGAKPLDIAGQTRGGSLSLTAGTLTIDNGPLDAAAGDVTLFADTVHLGQKLTAHGLNVTTVGDITQDTADTSKGVVLSGNASFTAGAGSSIQLGNDGNDFAGAVAFNSSAFNPADPSSYLKDVTIHDRSDFDVQGLTISGALDVKSVNGSISQSGNIVADSLTAAAAGDIIFGTADIPGSPQPQSFANQINSLGAVNAGGQFYLYNNKDLDILGAVQGGTVIIRSVGNLSIGHFDPVTHLFTQSGGPITGTGAGFLLGGLNFDVVLSAEAPTPNPLNLQPEFHNGYHSTAADSAIRTASGSGFMIFSFDPALNNPSANIGQNSLNFNGLTAQFQNNNSSYSTPGSIQDSSAFLFASAAAQISQGASSESAKAFVDVMKINPYTGASSSEADTPLPPIFPTIWTSSYEVYRLEKAATEKKAKKKLSLRPAEVHLSLALD